MNLYHGCILTIFLCGGSFISVKGGCCNDNYWCDGDPSFVVPPKITQRRKDSFVLVRWRDSNLRLGKCVDYFFVEYYPTKNGLQNITERSQVLIAPVSVERESVVDDWEATINPLNSKYISNITVSPDTDYIFTIVAVDKGAGWGEMEGSAKVHSDRVHFRTNPSYIPDPNPNVIKLQEMKDKYSPLKCNKNEFCESFVKDWISDVVNRVKNYILPSHDPEFLPSMRVRDGDRFQRYKDGRLYELSAPSVKISDLETDEWNTYVNISLQFRFLRTTFSWRSFFRAGVVTMYHTCGKELPLTLVEEPTFEEVKEILTETGCYLPMRISLAIPRFFEGGSRRSRYKARVFVSRITLDLKSRDFKFDVPWLFSNFHNLTGLWSKQKLILKDKMIRILNEAFTTSIRDTLKSGEWLKLKVKSVELEMNRLRTLLKEEEASKKNNLKSKRKNS